MRFYADLHVHSKYSRATSKDCDLENLAYWGRKKGITVIGTGDFTHPAWIGEIKEKLVPAEPGLFRLRPEIEKKVAERLPPSCRGTTRFMLSVEISTIYKKGDKTRKIHHLIYAPTLAQAEHINARLGKIGNIRSDGRPILGLDSRHLLEIVLEAGKDCYLVPAHIWTPWFAVLGSKSGFDCVADCYGDLAAHVFAVETGLSSDPEMNWRISHLDRYRLVSNSDAHSPGKLGREANVFETDLDYFAMKRALETGAGFGGSVEFFPEEGKYHMDGHRKCNIRFTPEESRAHDHICPVCSKPLTLGVMYRVMELADRKEGGKPDVTDPFKSLIPMPEMIGETLQVGPASKKVAQNYEGILSKLGSELGVLNDLPLDKIQKSASSLMAEAVARMRQGRVIREAGYDGEYGVIKLFKTGELKRWGGAGVLFDVTPVIARREAPKQSQDTDCRARLQRPRNDRQTASRDDSPSPSLDPEQQRAMETLNGPVLVTAGPGSGKTRVLTHRVAYLMTKHHVAPEKCLTITFTRRAAEEMRERLKVLVPRQWEKIPVMTFHGLAFKILEDNRTAAGLPRGFRVIEEGEKRAPDQGLLDYDDLIPMALQLLEEDPGLVAFYRKTYPYVSIDEYQDIDEPQFRLIQRLVPKDGNIFAIGDPDQAIYGFRGADVGFFLRFEALFIRAYKYKLRRNYRSGRSILSASSQMIAPASLVESREVLALLEDTGKVVIHHARTEKSEAEFVVHSLEKLIGGHSFFSIDTGRSEGEAQNNYSFSDFAVLYRTKAQAAPLAEALERSGIPFQHCTHDKKNQSDAQDMEDWDPRADRVSLLTLHSAKGLEFPVVFIAGCEDGILPLKFGAKTTEKNLAEERRLFFVGMTRAKDRLFLSHARKRLWRGKVREQPVSPFLKDIEEELLERQQTTHQARARDPQLELL